MMGMVTSRRTLDSALVHDDLTTREGQVLRDRDAMPTCTHAARSVYAQVLCVAHTSRATCIAGCAQCLGTGDQGRST
jgi:hypothetical protein